MSESAPPKNTKRSGKSPLIFLFLMAVLVVATLVVAAEYFVRPQMELELKSPKQNMSMVKDAGATSLIKK